jgi:hypothetical protein
MSILDSDEEQRARALRLSEVIAQDAKEVAQWQTDSFPQDPVLLYRIDTCAVNGEMSPSLFALPKPELPNLDNTVEAVFFDIIQGDVVQEVAFFGMSVWITKVVMCSFKDVQHYPSLTVVDEDRRAVRASKVFLGLTGIGR